MIHRDQFIAPEGFRTIRAGVVHHRLRTDPRAGRVLFVVFTDEVRARLVIVEHGPLIEALGKAVIPAPQPQLVPPWLAFLRSPDQIAARIAEAVSAEGPVRNPNNPARLVESRFCHLQSALDDIGEIFSADSPSHALNTYARRCDPPQNESRFRAMFYAYVAFGYSDTALFPAVHRRGRWNRLEPGRHTPLGRPSNDGSRSPFIMTPDLVGRITASFTAQAQLGLTRDKVYAAAMRREFGCHTETANGRTVFAHKAGKAFPTPDQYWYRCELQFGRDGIKKALRGEETYRNREAPSEGSYASSVGNVCERIHGDVSHSKAQPKSYVSDRQLPKMIVCRLIDALSGMCVGIGAGHDTENRDAYLEAVFCMAIPKSLFGKLIGYPIEDSDWPGSGVPTWLVVDRGPGAAVSVLEQLQEHGIGRPLTPSNSPQSNSIVESRHPRSATMTGAPTFLTSDLTPVEMFKQEVELTLLANRSSSALARASNTQIVRGEITPLAIYSGLLKELRTDARPVAIDQAVRAFLPAVKFTVRDGLLYLHSRPFGGKEFRGALSGREIKSLDGMLLKGYCMTISTRHAWVEVNRQLVMVDALTRYRDGDQDLYLSLSELSELGGRSAQLETVRRSSRAAELVASQERFERQAEKSLDEPTRRRGQRRRPKSDDISAEVGALKEGR